MFKTTIAAQVRRCNRLCTRCVRSVPYVNVETNAGWAGDDYTGATTDAHVGYEGALGDSGASFYVQGSAIVSVDGEELSTRVSGKAGVGIPVTDALSAYGEVKKPSSRQKTSSWMIWESVVSTPSSTTSDIKSGYPNDLPKGGFFMVKFGLTLTIY